MKSPQVINLLEDSVLAFDGVNVIDNTTQLPITALTHIEIRLNLIDLISGAAISSGTLSMAYIAACQHWVLSISSIVSLLTDRHKYVGSVTDISGNNMRTFKIAEFAVDNDSFEQTWMRLPYQIEIGGGAAWMYWYDDIANFSDPTHRKFKAQSYMGGSGTTFATSPDKVTHRGPIVEV